MEIEVILRRLREIEARADNPWCDKWIRGLILDDIPWLCGLVRKLLTVAEAARVIEKAIRYQSLSQQGGCYLLAREDVEDLREALAALEEGDSE